MQWHRLVFGCLALMLGACNAAAQEKPFGLWLQEFRTEAADAGIPARVLDDALTNIQPNERIIALDRKQPESHKTFTQYINDTVTPGRVKQGRRILVENAALLDAISKRYGVPARYIVALWGIETSYGANKGNFSLFESLATLAYEGRRADFFRAELLDALQILKEEKVLAGSLTSSWAGAMGHPQFMPSSYHRFAVDWDQDGHRDIWNSVPDSFASIANYLSESGWDGSIMWGRQVKVPADFTSLEADINAPKSLQEWARRGVTRADGSALSDHDMKAAIIYPGRPDEGSYLVTNNYQVLLKWNRSRYFATAVGLLADRIAQ